LLIVVAEHTPRLSVVPEVIKCHHLLVRCGIVAEQRCRLLHEPTATAMTKRREGASNVPRVGQNDGIEHLKEVLLGFLGH
jgi:hypothetical protein